MARATAYQEKIYIFFITIVCFGLLLCFSGGNLNSNRGITKLTNIRPKFLFRKKISYLLVFLFTETCPNCRFY
jgi:hypothetical protein